MKRLNLEHNKLRVLSFERHDDDTPVLGDSLVQIIASYNDIETLGDLTALQHCVSLYMDHNRLTSGFSELRCLQALQLLDLAYNELNMSLQQFFRYVLQHLRDLPRLEYLALGGNPMVARIPHFRYFIINEMPQLRFIDYEPVTAKDRKKARQLATLGTWKEKTKRPESLLEPVMTDVCTSRRAVGLPCACVADPCANRRWSAARASHRIHLDSGMAGLTRIVSVRKPAVAMQPVDSSTE